MPFWVRSTPSSMRERSPSTRNSDSAQLGRVHDNPIPTGSDRSPPADESNLVGVPASALATAVVDDVAPARGQPAAAPPPVPAASSPPSAAPSRPPSAELPAATAAVPFAPIVNRIAVPPNSTTSPPSIGPANHQPSTPALVRAPVRRNSASPPHSRLTWHRASESAKAQRPVNSRAEGRKNNPLPAQAPRRTAAPGLA